ncbi:MAG: hypothetical protein JWQ20_1976 [Conexibacter sp.]|nr:hypothetical protein [Conexibacter sp.]
MDFARVAPVLRGGCAFGRGDGAFDPIAVAAEVGRDGEPVLEDLHTLESAGLMLAGR